MVVRVRSVRRSNSYVGPFWNHKSTLKTAKMVNLGSFGGHLKQVQNRVTGSYPQPISKMCTFHFVKNTKNTPQKQLILVIFRVKSRVRCHGQG